MKVKIFIMEDDEFYFGIIKEILENMSLAFYPNSKNDFYELRKLLCICTVDYCLDSIKKESKFELSEQKITLINPEDFFQLSIDNNGCKDINLHFESEDGKFVFKTSISPNCNLKINREDIIWDRKLNDLFTVDSTDTSCVCVYTTTTNLSTIKSQIKKGRELIQKKVKKNFENIDKNGIKKFF